MAFFFPTPMDTYRTSLLQFLNGPMPNTWLIHDKISIYVRKAFHIVEGHKCCTFDVANVSVDTSARGQGIFTNWLAMAESEASQYGLDGVYVENLLNLRLADWLARRGYKQTGQPELPCFYLPVSEMASTVR